mmetsp:Transcript_37068/g.103133  ORF Transcript_37068/g.103133 Transcript_37068/m.103133 type:complete len:441 (+) Transcript_37068:1091-2413(+)
MAPSLPSLLWFKEMLLKLPCTRSISAMAPAARWSIAQPSRASTRRCANRRAASATTLAPSAPISLLERLSCSSLVASSCRRARQPGARRPTSSAAKTLKGLNCASPATSSSNPLSPMTGFWETSREVTPALSSNPSAADSMLRALLLAFSLVGVEGSEPREEHASSEGGSQVLASSRVVSGSSSLERRIRVAICLVKRGRPLRRNASTSAAMLRAFMPFSERSTPSHSLPRTTKSNASFLEKWLISFNKPLYAAMSGLLFSRMLAKFSADAYQEVSKNEGFFILRQTFRGSKSMAATVSRSRDWQHTQAKTNFARRSSGTGWNCRLSSSLWSTIRCLSVVVCLRTRISSRTSPALKSQKLRFQTPGSSPCPVMASNASAKKPCGTCFALAPMAMSFSCRASSSPPRAFTCSRPSSTSSVASAHLPSLTLRSAALWHASAR